MVLCMSCKVFSQREDKNKGTLLTDVYSAPHHTRPSMSSSCNNKYGVVVATPQKEQTYVAPCWLFSSPYHNTPHMMEYFYSQQTL